MVPGRIRTRVLRLRTNPQLSKLSYTMALQFLFMQAGLIIDGDVNEKQQLCNWIYI